MRSRLSTDNLAYVSLSVKGLAGKSPHSFCKSASSSPRSASESRSTSIASAPAIEPRARSRPAGGRQLDLVRTPIDRMSAANDQAAPLEVVDHRDHRRAVDA
jgi:hypothetical protein